MIQYILILQYFNTTAFLFICLYQNQVGTLEDFHISRSRFLRVMNGYFQGRPHLQSHGIEAIASSLKRMEHPDVDKHTNLISNKSSDSTTTDEHLRIEGRIRTEKSHPLDTCVDLTRSEMISRHLDFLCNTNLEDVVTPTITPSISESISKVILLTSLFVECLEALFDAMDVEWKDISFDDDVETIPLGKSQEVGRVPKARSI